MAIRSTRLPNCNNYQKNNMGDRPKLSQPIKANHQIQFGALSDEAELFCESTGYVSGPSTERRKSPSLRKSPRASPLSMNGTHTRTPSPHIGRKSRTPSPGAYGSRRKRTAPIRSATNSTGSAFERRQRTLTSPSPHSPARCGTNPPAFERRQRTLTSPSSHGNSLGQSRKSRARSPVGPLSQSNRRDIRDSKCPRDPTSSTTKGKLSSNGASHEWDRNNSKSSRKRKSSSSDNRKDFAAAVAAAADAIARQEEAARRNSSLTKKTIPAISNGTNKVTNILSESHTSPNLSPTPKTSKASLSCSISSAFDSSVHQNISEVGEDTKSDQVLKDSGNIESEVSNSGNVNNTGTKSNKNTTTTQRYESYEENYSEPATPRDLQFLNDSSSLLGMFRSQNRNRVNNHNNTSSTSAPNRSLLPSNLSEQKNNSTQLSQISMKSKATPQGSSSDDISAKSSKSYFKTSPPNSYLKATKSSKLYFKTSSPPNSYLKATTSSGVVSVNKNDSKNSKIQKAIVSSTVKCSTTNCSLDVSINSKSAKLPKGLKSNRVVSMDGTPDIIQNVVNSKMNCRVGRHLTHHQSSLVTSNGQSKVNQNTRLSASRGRPTSGGVVLSKVVSRVRGTVPTMKKNFVSAISSASSASSASSSASSSTSSASSSGGATVNDRSIRRFKKRSWADVAAGTDRTDRAVHTLVQSTQNLSINQSNNQTDAAPTGAEININKTCRNHEIGSRGGLSSTLHRKEPMVGETGATSENSLSHEKLHTKDKSTRNRRNGSHTTSHSNEYILPQEELINRDGHVEKENVSIVTEKSEFNARNKSTPQKKNNCDQEHEIKPWITSNGSNQCLSSVSKIKQGELRDGAVPPPPPEVDTAAGTGSSISNTCHNMKCKIHHDSSYTKDGLTKSNEVISIDMIGNIISRDSEMSFEDIRKLEKILMMKKSELLKTTKLGTKCGSATDTSVENSQENGLMVLESLVERQQQTLVDLGYIAAAPGGQSNGRTHKAAIHGYRGDDDEIERINTEKRIHTNKYKWRHDVNSSSSSEDEDKDAFDDATFHFATKKTQQQSQYSNYGGKRSSSEWGSSCSRSSCSSSSISSASSMNGSLICSNKQNMKSKSVLSRDDKNTTLNLKNGNIRFSDNIKEKSSNIDVDARNDKNKNHNVTSDEHSKSNCATEAEQGTHSRSNHHNTKSSKKCTESDISCDITKASQREVIDLNSKKEKIDDNSRRRISSSNNNQHRNGNTKMFDYPISNNQNVMEESNSKQSRQHRRDFGKSPGGIMFRQSPHPLVPPLNLVALTRKNITPGVPAYRVVGSTSSKKGTHSHGNHLKQPPLSRSSRKNNGHRSKSHHHHHHQSSSIFRQGPRQITREITANRHKLGLYSPRAQVAYSPRDMAYSASRHRKLSKSPALSKCVETILSPRSAFSKASSISSGTSSAFSTPSSSPFPTPRSARTPRGSYLSYRSPRTPRTPRSYY